MFAANTAVSHFVVLEGGAKKLGDERGVTAVWITLSHTEHHAMAMIVVEGGSGAPRTMPANGPEGFRGVE